LLPELIHLLFLLMVLEIYNTGQYQSLKPQTGTVDGSEVDFRDKRFEHLPIVGSFVPDIEGDLRVKFFQNPIPG
jgi:hypothetical protein